MGTDGSINAMGPCFISAAWTPSAWIYRFLQLQGALQRRRIFEQPANIKEVLIPRVTNCNLLDAVLLSNQRLGLVRELLQGVQEKQAGAQGQAPHTAQVDRQEAQDHELAREGFRGSDTDLPGPAWM